jgi:uncharacterized protein YbjT (DUF2867 family)
VLWEDLDIVEEALTKIAVTTPTGNVGRHVVTMLVRAGVRPTVLLRDPARLDPALREDVDVVTADQTDADAVVAATRGVDALYWVDPSTAAEDPLADYARFSAAVARAVRENAIPRTVFQSSVGAEKRHGAGEIDGLADTEVRLDDTGASVLHLRCGFFYSNLLLQVEAVRAGVVPVVLPVDRPMPWLAPRDIAEVAAAVLGMSTGLRDDFTPEQPRTVATTTPTTLASWAYDTLRPLLR